MLTCLLSVGFCSSLAFAQTDAGRIHSMKGFVTIERGGNAIKAAANSKIFPNDIIKTGTASMAELVMKDGSSLTMGPDSILNINQFLFSHGKEKPSFIVRMAKGIFIYISGAISKVHPGSVKLKTSGATIGIRGTKIVIKVLGIGPDSGKEDLIVLNLRDPAGKVGVVTIDTEAGEQILNKEFHAVKVTGSQAPEKQVFMSREQVMEMVPQSLHPFVIKNYNPPLAYQDPVLLLEAMDESVVPVEQNPEIVSPYSP